MNTQDECIMEAVYERLIRTCVRHARDEWRWYCRDLRACRRPLSDTTFSHLSFLRRKALRHLEGARKLQENRERERRGLAATW